MRKFSGVAVLVFLSIAIQGVAQQKSPNPVLTADSLASGNYKDVLNSFFQLAFEQLAGPEKELKFTGTPFAVMAKLDTTLLVDKKYLEYKTLRNINYAFSLRLDTAYKFNGFTSGIKYALINKRDETVSRSFLKMVENSARAKELLTMNMLIGQSVSAIDSANGQEAVSQEWDDFVTGNTVFGALSQQLRDTITSVITRNAKTGDLAANLLRNDNFNLAQTADSVYQDLKENFNKNLLWTIGVTNTTYKDQFAFSNIVFHSELIQGINKFNDRKNDLDLHIQSALQLVDDTLKAGRDLKRAVFSFEPGINLAIKTKNTKRSYLELKFCGGYYHNFGTLYANDDRDRVFVNGTVRIRILNDIWVPFEVKYDPRNGNIFGFINVRANFRALAGAAKQL